MLHVIGLLPIVRSRAFDMVSDGKTFKLSIPPMNKFIEGPAQDSPQPSTNTLENLRPHVFFDSLLLHEIGASDIAVLEQGTDVVQDTSNKKKSWELPDYIVNVIAHDGDTWRLQRKITFSRIDLKPHRQMIYDRNGAIATEAVYDNFADFQGVNFPSQITITSSTIQPSIAFGPPRAVMRSGIVMNGPAPIMLVMLSAVAGSRLKRRWRWGCSG